MCISRRSLPGTECLKLFFSDNAPQSSSQELYDFAAAYSFTHTTSSPRFAQSNGETQHHVQMVKKLLKKAKDPYLALLAYRATPIAHGYSPAQLLMSRRLHTQVHQHPSLLDPERPYGAVIAAKEREKRGKDTASFNNRHRVRDLSQLSQVNQCGSLMQSLTQPHFHTSWIALQAPSGGIDTILSLFQRMFYTHLTHLHPALHHNQVGSPECPVSHPTPAPEGHTLICHKLVHTHTQGHTTRCGRGVRKPHRLDL